MDKIIVVIVLGLPGSGKSYFAERLAEKLQLNYANSDVLRHQLFPIRKYTPDEKMKVYAEMEKKMKKSIQQNKGIVLDATFYKENIRNAFIKSAVKLGSKILFIEVLAKEKIIKQRMNRQRPYSEADYSVYLKIKKTFEPLEEEHLILESTQNNIDTMIESALSYIDKHHEQRTDK